MGEGFSRIFFVRQGDFALSSRQSLLDRALCEYPLIFKKFSTQYGGK